jgi:peroxiredoxin
MRADITVGSAFPDYELPDHTGTPRRLSELQGEDPMIIVLAREAYSAKDQRQQQGLAELWREMKPGVGYCQLVTITTSDPQETFNYRSGVGAEWPFLADPGASSNGISTSPSTPTRSTTRWCRTPSCASPA